MMSDETTVVKCKVRKEKLQMLRLSFFAWSPQLTQYTNTESHDSASSLQHHAMGTRILHHHRTHYSKLRKRLVSSAPFFAGIPTSIFVHGIYVYMHVIMYVCLSTKVYTNFTRREQQEERFSQEAKSYQYQKSRQAHAFFFSSFLYSWSVTFYISLLLSFL